MSQVSQPFQSVEFQSRARQQAEVSHVAATGNSPLVRSLTVAAPKKSRNAGVAPSTGAVARFFLRLLFWLARRAPWALRRLKPLAVWGTLYCSQKVRRGVYANARRILGPYLPDADCAAFASRVVSHFYEFVVDVGRSSGMSVAELRDRIEAVEGRDAYIAHRKQGGGAIIVTAHMGSFEIGLTALTEVEPHIHVVFKRDSIDGFETIRRTLREKLNVQEAAIDDGWNTWIHLRDALAQNHVVVMQADRAMPGQKSQAVPMLGGRLLLPLGPVKLAQISGAAIIPVFTVRTPSGRCRIFAEAPIRVDTGDQLIDGIHPALLRIGRDIERFVGAYPDQWLMLDAAFLEDAGAVKRSVKTDE